MFILSVFKDYLYVCKLFTQEEYGHMVLLSLFDAVDDTVLVKKIVFPVSFMRKIYSVSTNG